MADHPGVLLLTGVTYWALVGWLVASVRFKSCDSASTAQRLLLDQQLNMDMISSTCVWSIHHSQC